MAPTRELALQIATEGQKFGASSGVRIVAVYGGATKGPQVKALQRGCDIIVGTPGRIKDVLDVRGGGENAVCRTDKMQILVLDEADRMLDMGFERDIRSIVWACFLERTKQTFMFSATWPVSVQDIAYDLLSEDHVKVTVGTGGSRLTASKSVMQQVHVVEPIGRWKKLMELVSVFHRGRAQHGKRVIIFANRKETVQKIATACATQGLAVAVLSGARSQSQRESTIKQFKSGQVTMVVATDVASRGLDIKGIRFVINYELPCDDFQDYVHRIGRTGRAGETGQVSA
jgi:ATP-dependent RNA helicase DDX5/DBP2